MQPRREDCLDHRLNSATTVTCRANLGHSAERPVKQRPSIEEVCDEYF